MINEESSSSPQRLYGRIWRWHFFAALIVIPFVLWQSVTGALYLWHRELAALAYPELLSVVPRSERATYEQQLRTASEHHPGKRIDGIEIPDDPARSTAVFFRDDNELAYPAFVNPYTGEYLGAVASTRWIAGLTRGLHGGWPIKPLGSYLLELGASWAIVMILTGLYLWWPRNAQSLAGLLYPRLHSGSRTFWRDLHSTAGVYFSVIVLAFLFSALPWTTFWGDRILQPIQRATGQVSPTAMFFGGGADHHHTAHSDSSAVDNDHARHSTAKLSLDELVAKARAAGAVGTIEVRLNTDMSLVGVRNQRPRAANEVLLQLDPRSGAVVGKAVWEDYPLIPKIVSTGIDLHEGTFFGRANQIFNTIVALALMWLSVTGFVGWYKRRPQGGLAVPARRELTFPKPVIAAGAGLCVMLPLLGASVLGIAIVDRVFGRYLGARS